MTFNKILTLIFILNRLIKFRKINFYFIIDFYSLLFILIVIIISLIVFSFINIYIYKDLNLLIFLCITLIFIFSILLLINSGNLWRIILGWEGLGFSSYYLIFFYNNFDAWIRSLKTFFNNKVGDFFLILRIVIIITNNEITKIIIYIFIFALITKTAQFPFIAWLPIAIAAPTPISSLVHSSTLVTAGIFVLLRYNFFLKNLINQNFFLSLCLITILFRRLKAINENDIKKIIALSTLSQISLIMFLVILNIKFISFIYLCNHALFKSLIFINIGIIMLKNFSNQLEININTFNRIKLYFISFKLSCLNLINIPFFSSFFLKEKIIYMFYNSQISYLKFVIFIFNSFLTINYSLKFLFFFDKKLRNINYNIKFYYIINIIIFITFFSIIFSKLMFQTIVLKRKSTIILYIYMISIIINFKIYKVKMKLINNLIFLNILFFSQTIFIFIKINKLKEIELWIEYILIYNFKKFENKNILKLTYTINIKIIFFFFFLWILLLY